MGRGRPDQLARPGRPAVEAEPWALPGHPTTYGSRLMEARVRRRCGSGQPVLQMHEKGRHDLECRGSLRGGRLAPITTAERLQWVSYESRERS